MRLLPRVFGYSVLFHFLFLFLFLPLCSRVAFGGDDRWQSNQTLMFLNIIMSTVMVLMLGMYQRQFIWIYIFSMGANMSNIWCHFVFREYWFCVCGLCQHFCVGCKAIFTWHCKVCVMYELMKWNMVGIEIFFFFFFFFFFFCSKESSVTVRSGKRQANHFDTWAFVTETETTVIRRGTFLFQSVLLLLGDWFGFNGKEKT